MIFQLYSTALSIKQLIFQTHPWYSSFNFRSVYYSTLLAYIAVSVKNCSSMFQRWTAYQQHVVDELIEYWHVQTPWFSLHFEYWLQCSLVGDIFTVIGW